MSLLFPQIAHFFSEHEKITAKLKYKHRFNFFQSKYFELPSGISISRRDAITKSYFANLKKKLKLPFEEKAKPSHEFFDSWKESDFLCHCLSDEEYFTQRKHAQPQIECFSNVLFEMENNPQIVLFHENYKKWLKILPEYQLDLNGPLRVNLMENSVMLANVRHSRVKDFKLILNRGFHLQAELSGSKNEENFSKLTARFKGGFL